jgi:hypothetical protein
MATSDDWQMFQKTRGLVTSYLILRMAGKILEHELTDLFVRLRLVDSKSLRRGGSV